MARPEPTEDSITTWTPVTGTPFEAMASSAEHVAVHLLGDNLVIDTSGTATVRLRMFRDAGVYTIREYGTRMHPRPGSDQAPTGPSVRIAVSHEQARASAQSMNALAGGPEGANYWVLLAEPVTRERVVFPSSAEFYTAWEVAL